MRSLFILCAVFLAVPASWAQVAVPDTPAGHALSGWLTAFNAGDPAQLRAYYGKYLPAPLGGTSAEFRAQTGGFELLRIDASVLARRFDERFMIRVPFQNAINPITHKNWEGTGVIPDVKVPAADALATAERLATERLASRAPRTGEGGAR